MELENRFKFKKEWSFHEFAIRFRSSLQIKLKFLFWLTKYSLIHFLKFDWEILVLVDLCAKHIK